MLGLATQIIVIPGLVYQTAVPNLGSCYPGLFYTPYLPNVESWYAYQLLPNQSTRSAIMACLALDIQTPLNY